MGLQQCRECKKDVSTEAKDCPNCGAPVKKRTSTGTKIVGSIIIMLLLLAFIGAVISPPPAPRTPPPGSDPSTVSDAQIYREFEICANNAKATVGDDKQRGQALFASCMMKLQKYGDARARKAFAMYFDLPYDEKPKKKK